jgi:secondary thiamine-phosphate synthase enzyme
MRQDLATISVTTHGAGLYPFTDEARRFVRGARLGSGLLTCFIRHTSASLLIQENADPDVLEDIESFMRRLVSRDPALYRHTTEGPDDMPSHIRSVLTASSLSIPICNGDLALGIWQGLYVFEHRDRAHVREILLHAIGE